MFGTGTVAFSTRNKKLLFHCDVEEKNNRCNEANQLVTSLCVGATSRIGRFQKVMVKTFLASQAPNDAAFVQGDALLSRCQ